MAEGRGGIARAGAIVMALLLVSRMLGWVRISVLAAVFGPGPELDAFYAAFRLPDLVFQLVAAGSLGSALLPVIGSLIATGERDRAWRVVSTVTNVLLIALVAFGAVFALFAPQLVPLLAPGFGPEVQAETVALTRVMVLSPVLLGLASVTTNLLNVQGRFAASAAAPIAYNLGIIVGAVALTPAMGTMGLAVGVVAGALANLLVQVWPLIGLGIRYRPAIELAEPLARRVLVLLAPRTLGQGVSQVTFLVVTIVASAIGTGAVTNFNFAFTLAQVPMALIGMPLGVVVFPTLVAHRATGATDAFDGLIMRSLRLLVFLVVPVTALAVILAPQAIAIVLGFGRLAAADAAAISATFAALCAGLIGFTTNPILTRAFYAMEDTRTPVAVAIGAVAVNITLAPLLAPVFGLVGIGASMAIANTLESVVLLAILARRRPGIELGPLTAYLARVAALTAAAVVATIVVLAWMGAGAAPGIAGAFVQAVAGSLAFTAVFLPLAWLAVPDQVRAMLGVLPIRLGSRA